MFRATGITVYRGNDGFPGVARFASFAPQKDGKPTGQWASMPDHMVAKCAEAQALRRAFPHDLAGTQTTDETAHDRVTAWAEQVVTEPAAIEPARAASGQRSQIEKLFAGMGFEEHEQDEVRNILAAFTGSGEPVSAAELSQDQAAMVIDHLKGCNGSRPRLMELLAEAASDG